MALTTAQIQNAYVAFFNRPADVEGLRYWGSYTGSSADLLNTFAQSAEYKSLYSGMNNTQLVNAVYQNLFGHAPDIDGLHYWVDQLTQGKLAIGNIADAINKGALSTDATIITNKVAAATAFTDALDTTAEVVAYAGVNSTGSAAVKSWLAAVTSDAATLTNATSATTLTSLTTTVLNNVAANGQTYVLTKSLDNIDGTANNDTIIGSLDLTTPSNAELNTLAALDIVNGGAGIDTLKINQTGGPATVLPNLSNVEIIEVSSTVGATVDSSTVTGVTNLNIVKAGGAVSATAGATTDISVSVKEMDAAAVKAHTVDGGKNVTVTVADAGNTGSPDTVTIGGATAAKGDVVVNVTGKAYEAATGNVSTGAITITGGQTVAVTQKATSSAAVATDKSADTFTQGAVTVNASTDTTTISVKQDATVAAVNAADSTGGVTETATVKFGALKNGDALVSNGLTFTAKADMTAAEVASAFANLVTGLAVSGKDTQGSGLATKGTYTGDFQTGVAPTGFTAAAASDDTVVFTGSRSNINQTDLTFTLTNTSGNSVAPVVTTVQGKANDATATGGVMGVAAGAVTVGGGANATAVKTITVDGYAATSSGATGTTSALETLNLSNGGDFSVASAAGTLALNLKAVGTAAAAETLTSAAVSAVAAVLDLNNTATTTLNVKSDGVNTVDLRLDGASSVATLNVSGTGLLNSGSGSQSSTLTTIKVTETAGLTLNSQATTNITSVDTSGTTGTVTLTLDGSKATYTGGAGVDKVTISNANTAIAKAVSLGAGDDTLTLNVTSGSVAVPTVDLKGGDGTDTLAMSAADAVALTANGTFAGKVDGFEKLSIGALSATGTVNLANMDNINYVVSANSSSVSSAATKTTFTLDVVGSTATTADTVAFNGSTYAFTNNAGTAASFATQLYALIVATPPSGGTWIATGVSGTKITFEAVAAGVLGTPANSAFMFSDADSSGSTATFATAQVSAGAAAGASAAALTIDKMASGGTLELTGTGAGAIVKVTDAATGTADVLNVVTKVASNVGTVTAVDVETFNLNITDADTSFAAAAYAGASKTANVSTTILAVAGNANTKTVNVEGAGNLTLDVSANTKLATVDANKATGVLTLDLSSQNGVAITVTGGSANDVLKASAGANAKADVLLGGAGNDTLWAGANGAKLTGGDGNDLFVLQVGNKESNTYSSIQDFKAGDVLQLNVAAGTAVTSFAKLTAVLSENTATFSNFVDAAITQANAGEAVWFNFKGNAYVVIDNTTNSTVFENTVDAAIELVGVDLANASYNSTNGTIALV